MANNISLQNCKRFERHNSSLKMRVLKASVELMKLSGADKREEYSADIARDKPRIKE